MLGWPKPYVYAVYDRIFEKFLPTPYKHRIYRVLAREGLYGVFVFNTYFTVSNVSNDRMTHPWFWPTLKIAIMHQKLSPKVRQTSAYLNRRI